MAHTHFIRCYHKQLTERNWINTRAEKQQNQIRPGGIRAQPYGAHDLVQFDVAQSANNIISDGK